jgi:hypothetical protein
MKKIIFFALTFVAAQSYAKVSKVLSDSKLPKKLEFNCGKQAGMDVTLKITHAKANSFMPYTANLQAPGVDKTTGMMIRSKTYKMEGDTDLWKTNEGDLPVIHFNEVDNPVHQIILEKKTKKDDVAEAAYYKDVNNGQAQALSCKVTKASSK